jgi:hypothetical protein
MKTCKACGKEWHPSPTFAAKLGDFGFKGVNHV